MNKFIQAIKDLNQPFIKELLQKDSKWISWHEDNGKNALHYLCAVEISKQPQKAETSLQILKLLLKSGMDINSIHSIPGNCDSFPATPLWYAYTRGRNPRLFTYLLKSGAGPNNCMFAIAWYNDVKAAELFKKHGAKIENDDGKNTPFLAAFTWKKFDVAKWFLQHGANVNAYDNDGNTALFYAVKRKYEIEYIELLLQFKADFNKENNEGISPKNLAELNRQKKILSLFNANKNLSANHGP